MARPDTNYADKKAQIIEAATKVFAHYGYEGTTNKLIAEEVKESTGQNFTPALIYHYFPEGKLQLFVAVFESFQPLQRLGEAVIANTALPPELFFKAVAVAYLKIIKEPNALELIRLVFGEGHRHPEIAQQMVGKVAPIFVFPLVSYTMQQVEKGLLKPIDPITVMLEFFGPLFIRALLLSTLGKYVPFPVPEEEDFIEIHLRTFLEGLRVGEADQKGT